MKNGSAAVKILAAFSTLMIVLLSLPALARASVNAAYEGASQEISIRPGFNFVSFTVVPGISPYAFKQQHPAIEDIFYFSPAAGSFLSAGEGSLTSLGTARGYILRSSSQQLLNISGSPAPAAGNVDLKKGFNLVGFSRMPEYVTASALMSEYAGVKGFYKWMSAAGSFIQVVRNDSGAVELLDGADPKLNEGESYFIDLAADAVLNYDGYEIKLTFTAPLPRVSEPAFSVAAGAYNSTQQVEISSATAGAEIFYTLDGSEPGTGKSRYTGEIMITATTTIKAVAVKSGMTDSPVASVALTVKLPEIKLTYLPSFGAVNEYLTGRVENVSFSGHACVILIRTAGKWWIKPGAASKSALNPSDGSFSCNYSNGGEDYLADKIKIYLVPSAYSPPDVNGVSEPPSGLALNALASLETDIVNSPRWSMTVSPYGPCPDTFEIYYGGSQYMTVIPPKNIVRPVFGPKSEWGAYFYFMPAVRTGGKYLPDSAFKVDYFQTALGKLWLSISGSQGGLSVKGDLVISPPAGDQLSMDVKINQIDASGIVFDQAPVNEIYKKVNIKSMFLSADYCDSTTLFLDSNEYPFPARQSGITEEHYYQNIIPPSAPVTARHMLLKGAYSKWQRQNRNLPSPTFDVYLDSDMPVAANNDMGTAIDANSDTLNLWTVGQTADIKPYKYTIIVKE